MSESTQLRVGVLGTGRVGRMHAEAVALKLAGAELTAVFDADADLAAALGAQLGARARGSVEEVIEAEDVDAVAICTPTPFHADNVIAAARAGKAIFCEKPISLVLAEVDRALAVVEEAGVPFQIGFNQRFDLGHAAVAAAVAKGEVGEPQLARISSRDPEPPPASYARTSGGIFLDMTIHDFDLARHVVGSEVVEVFATGAVLVEPEFAEIGDLDTVVVVLTHANGCLTTIDNSRQAVYGYDQRIEVFGPSGMAASENPLVNAAIVRDRQGVRGATLVYPFLERYAASYLAEWDEFVDAVRSGRQPSVGIGDARPPLVIGLAAWRSIQEGRPVRVEEITAEDASPVMP
ncbi:MAG: inositol 2-dehydrogenase [Actinobacteria bacterium]|nr:inositol 2-dehydrogenase [Actinomycetota bacterium]